METPEAAAEAAADAAAEAWPWGPRNAWDHVHDGVWMGGSAQPPGGGWAAVLTLSASTARSLPPANPYADHRWPFDDAAVDAPGLVRAWAQWVAETASPASPVLVRCAAGLNRSGLIVARALLVRGFGAEAAIALVRERRDPGALANPRFTAWLRDEPTRRPEGASAPAAETAARP